MFHKHMLFIHSFISIQPLGRFGRNQSSIRWPVWLWYAASWANFLGVGCHYFPPLLDVPTFATRCLHVRNDARDPNSQRWNCGREYCPVILPKWWLRPGLNPGTWVLKASTQLLDHRSRSYVTIGLIILQYTNLIFVFPCIIIYGFIRTSLMQIV